jgi:tetratricopeptide (TPR) repeat protein
MNKRIYTFFALLIGASMIWVSCQSNMPKDGIPDLKTTVSEAAPKEETDNIRQKYNEAKEALKKNPQDLKQYLNLATVFILEGRITGDGSYYGNAAVAMLNKVIDNPSSNNDQLFEAYSLKSAVLLNMHQFKDAKDMAMKGIALNGYNSGIYGALVDADVELGLYDSAVSNCDKMLSLRPDLRSYSRASYLRQIHGDNRGAIDAMKMAVEAGLPGAEQTEWARVTTGDLFMNIGRIDTAEILYKMALVYRPNYPYAEIGLAKVAKARKQYDSAIVHTENAIKIMSDPAFIAALADVYELKGEQDKALTIRKDVLKGIKEGLEEESENAIKHNANRELAQACLNAGNIQEAYKYAKADIDTRPDNIDANELMAWILFSKKEYSEAKNYAQKMLRKNTQNANSIYKAAAIYAAAGDAAKAAMLKKQADLLNPYADAHIKMLAGNF